MSAATKLNGAAYNQAPEYRGHKWSYRWNAFHQTWDAWVRLDAHTTSHGHFKELDQVPAWVKQEVLSWHWLQARKRNAQSVSCGACAGLRSGRSQAQPRTHQPVKSLEASACEPPSHIVAEQAQSQDAGHADAPGDVDKQDSVSLDVTQEDEFRARISCQPPLVQALCRPDRPGAERLPCLFCSGSIEHPVADGMRTVCAQNPAHTAWMHHGMLAICNMWAGIASYMPAASSEGACAEMRPERSQAHACKFCDGAMQRTSQNGWLCSLDRLHMFWIATHFTPVVARWWAPSVDAQGRDGQVDVPEWAVEQMREPFYIPPDDSAGDCEPINLGSPYEKNSNTEVVK